MENILFTILLIVSILLIAVVLLQAGKSTGASEALTGGNSGLFAEKKERGMELITSRITMTLGISFFVIAFILSVM